MPHISQYELIRNAVVRECLVDMADRDYIAARLCWRGRLPEQFLWNGLQALEKQFKAIVVLNGRSAKGFGHNIEKGLTHVLAIADLKVDPPKVIRDFVKYLNHHAPNRYLERPFYLRGAELFELDRAFWHFRRYCQDFRATARYLKKTDAEWLDMNQQWFTNPSHTRRPYRFRIQGGYLEETLEGRRGREQYDALVWKNVYYGKRDKGKIEFRPLGWSANPAHVRHPNEFAALVKVMDFPKDVAQALLP